jgi:Associated with zinc fingers
MSIFRSRTPPLSIGDGSGKSPPRPRKPSPSAKISDPVDASADAASQGVNKVSENKTNEPLYDDVRDNYENVVNVNSDYANTSTFSKTADNTTLKVLPKPPFTEEKSRSLERQNQDLQNRVKFLEETIDKMHQQQQAFIASKTATTTEKMEYTTDEEELEKETNPALKRRTLKQAHVSATGQNRPALANASADTANAGHGSATDTQHASGAGPSSANHEWQTVPQRQSKRQRDTTTPSPKAHGDKRIKPSNYNRYAPLAESTQETSNTGSKAQRVSRPPPIFLHGVIDVPKMIQCIERVIKREEYTYKVVSGKQVRIMTGTMEAYKRLLDFLRKEKLIAHTFRPKDDKDYRIVLRNIHPTIPQEEIKEAIEQLGHKVRGISNIKHRVSKKPLPLFFINLEPRENNKDIYNTKYLLNAKVTFEPPRKKREIPQCMRCQQYGHTKAYCMRPYRCVKCGEDHATTACKKPKEEKPKCALCLEEHPANYKGCKVYQQIVERKIKNRKIISGRNPNGRNAEPLAPQNDEQNTADPERNTQGRVRTGTTYAQVTSVGTSDEGVRRQNTSHGWDKLENIIIKQSQQMELVMQQISSLTALLTTLISKIDGWQSR